MKKIFVLVLTAILISCSPYYLLPERTETPMETAYPWQASSIYSPVPTTTSTLIPTFPNTVIQVPAQTLWTSVADNQTASVSMTPFPPLNVQKPYLVYAYMPSPIINIILLNPDGSGQKVIPISDQPMYFYGFSPNGEWGVLGKSVYDLGDISLSLIHIPDGEVRFISLIISSEIIEKYWWDDCSLPTYLFRQSAWSPDGRYLAFAANTTGTGFDLFTYDTELGVLRRLTNHSADILSITWSKDSNSIYYINGIQANGWGGYVTYTENVTQPANRPNQGIQTLFTSSYELKLNSVVGNKYLILLSFEKMGCNTGGGRSAKSVYVVNMVTDEKKEIWSGDISPSIAVDPRDGAILLFEGGYYSGHPRGLNIISFEGNKIATLDGGSSIIYQGGPMYTFLLSYDGGVFGINLNGTTKRISERKKASVDISPDYGWFVIYDDQGMDLFSKDDQMVDTLDLMVDMSDHISVNQILWRPDGKGLYFWKKEQGDYYALFYWSFSDFKTNLIKKCQVSEPDCGFYDLSWVT